MSVPPLTGLAWFARQPTAEIRSFDLQTSANSVRQSMLPLVLSAFETLVLSHALHSDPSGRGARHYSLGTWQLATPASKGLGCEGDVIVPYCAMRRGVFVVSYHLRPQRRPPVRLSGFSIVQKTEHTRSRSRLKIPVHDT